MGAIHDDDLEGALIGCLEVVIGFGAMGAIHDDDLEGVYCRQ
jgi:hypothetical protein